MTAAAAAFPPAPWRLRGWGFASVHLVDIAAARARVPSALHVVPVAPGKTLGGLAFLSYEAGSTLVYRELNVVAALVRAGASLAFWNARLYVDDPASLAGGHAIWGLPKVLATFEVSRGDDGDRVQVHDANGLAYDLRSAPLVPFARLAVPLPFALPLPAVGLRAAVPAWFTARLHARVALARVRMEPASGGVHGLTFARPLGAVRLEAFVLDIPSPTLSAGPDRTS